LPQLCLRAWLGPNPEDAWLSDVDCYLLVVDAAYQACRTANQLSINADDLCDYPHGQAERISRMSPRGGRSPLALRRAATV
jgi:hypothetical protein